MTTNPSSSPSSSEPGPALPPGPTYGKKRWTIGNSISLVEGNPQEPLGVSLAWILIPSLIAAIFIWMIIQ